MIEIEPSDHRVRVARMRRDRMVRRLLDSVMACHARHPQQGMPTVDEVIHHAAVSRATFYKYFNSIDEAVTKLADQLVDEMIQNLIELHHEDHKPFFRLTVAVHLFLLRSAIDPLWGAFVGRFNAPRSRGRLFQGISAHLAASREAGLVGFGDLAAARTFVVGGMLEAIREIAEGGQGSRAFVEEIITMIFLGLGIERDRAAAIIRDATIFIRGAAPDQLDWWQDPWTARPGSDA